MISIFRIVLALFIISFFTISMQADAAGLTPISGALNSYIKGEGSIHFEEILDLPVNKLPEKISGLFIINYPKETNILRLIAQGKDEKLYDLGTLPFSGKINMAKTDALYDPKDGLIHIFSQMPFRAFYYEAAYKWDRSNLRMTLVGEKHGDPSQEALDQAKTLLAKGKLKAAGEKLKDMLYPGAYYDANEMAVLFLKHAHRIALEKFRAGNNDSWIIFEEAIEAFNNIVGANWILDFKSRADYEKSAYAKYLAFSDFIAIINDYGFMLEQAGKSKDAVMLLGYVTRVAPDRTPAYLNLADALYKSGKKQEAGGYYKTYIKLMKSENREKEIPPRATERHN